MDPKRHFGAFSEIKSYFRIIVLKECTEPVASKRKAVVPAINKIHTRNSLEKMGETERGFFEEMNKIVNPLSILIKENTNYQY